MPHPSAVLHVWGGPLLLPLLRWRDIDCPAASTDNENAVFFKQTTSLLPGVMFNCSKTGWEELAYTMSTDYSCYSKPKLELTRAKTHTPEPSLQLHFTLSITSQRERERERKRGREGEKEGKRGGERRRLRERRNFQGPFAQSKLTP